MTEITIDENFSKDVAMLNQAYNALCQKHIKNPQTWEASITAEKFLSSLDWLHRTYVQQQQKATATTN